MRKICVITKACPVVIALSMPWPHALPAEEAGLSQTQDAIDEKLKPLLEQAQQMTVRFPSGAVLQTATLNPKPLIYYSDQERALPDSTLWVWHQNNVPVIFCKVERLKLPGSDLQNWQFCCVPAVEQLVDVEWNREFRWRAKEIGFRWTSLPSKVEPNSSPATRLTQLKELSRQFTADIENVQRKDREEMRLLTRPLYRYADLNHHVIDGVVFGLTSNGTNPDALLVIEATDQSGAESNWRYAIVGMSGDAIHVHHADKPVWSKPFTSGPGDHKSWMWYVSREN